MSIAWDYLTPLQRSQIKHCRPDLSEEHERLRESEIVCPELYYRPFHRYEGERQICKINHKSCVRQGGCSCYIFDEFLNKKEE